MYTLLLVLATGVISAMITYVRLNGSLVRRMGLAAIAGYLAMHILAFLLINPLLFPYHKKPQTTTHAIIFKDKHNHTLQGRWYPHPHAKATILYSHGNNEDLTDVSQVLIDAKKHGYQIFAYDYPGYGQSSGKPTYTNIFDAGDAAYDYLTQHLKVNPSTVIVYGRSLGTSVSIHIAKTHPCFALALQSPYLNLFRVVMPGLLFSPHDNLAAIRFVRAPILIIHGTKDEIVPVWHGRALAQAQPNTTYVELPEKHHNDMENDLIFNILTPFVKKHSISL